MTAEGGARGRVVALLLAALAGAMFGAGLLMSGLTQPATVIGFLDVGDWDPTLMIVMAGAAGVYAIAYRVIPRAPRPRFEPKFYLPTRRDLDLPLLAGAALFGIGWAFGGICPGPGLVEAGGGSTAGLAFLGAMIVGMHVEHLLARLRRPKQG